MSRGGGGGWGGLGNNGRLGVAGESVDMPIGPCQHNKRRAHFLHAPLALTPLAPVSALPHRPRPLGRRLPLGHKRS